MSTLLDFEKPILELEGKVKELRSLAAGSEIDIADEVARLEGRAAKLLSQTYGKLNAWQKTQVARHADRPHFTDYAAALVEEFTPLAGDRLGIVTNGGGAGVLAADAAALAGVPLEGTVTLAYNPATAPNPSEIARAAMIAVASRRS